MTHLKEELWRLIITAVVTILVIAAGSWFEYRTNFLENWIKLPNAQVNTEVAPQPVPEVAE